MCLVMLTSIGARHDNFGEAIDYWSVKGCVQPSLTLQRKVWIFFWWVGGGGRFYTGYSVVADGKTDNKIYKHSREPYSYKSNYHSNG